MAEQTFLYLHAAPAQVLACRSCRSPTLAVARSGWINSMRPLNSHRQPRKSHNKCEQEAQVLYLQYCSCKSTATLGTVYLASCKKTGDKAAAPWTQEAFRSQWWSGVYLVHPSCRQTASLYTIFSAYMFRNGSLHRLHGAFCRGPSVTKSLSRWVRLDPCQPPSYLMLS